HAGADEDRHGVGMALAGKISCDSYKVYAILGDGEIEEGIVWEAAMFASHYMLDNLVAVVDNNNLQIDGKITEVMSPYPIDEKFKAFGWHVINIDGHDFNQMEKAFDEAEKIVQKPTVIIMKTTKGKGVDYMEDSVDWHGKAPGDEDYERAMKQLREQLAQLEGSVK
ncbi:MAG: 1-deoxy-D-xylulose-5-phosphate synthase N-terminal domain-containing protein, partial [Oscillospiraceae bacterium]